MRAYGNWCGPGWTAGQYKDASELTDEDRQVPAIDELDMACKMHDIDLHDYPQYADRINANFVNLVKDMGITGKLFALAVQVAGPSPVGNLQSSEQAMPKKILRGVYEDEDGDLHMDIADNQIVNYETPARENKRKIADISPNDDRIPPAVAQRFPALKSFPDSTSSTQDTSPNTNPVREYMEGRAQVAAATPTSNMVQQRSTSSAPNGQSGSTETPITPADPHYLYPLTETVKSGISCWFSVMRPQTNAPASITLKLNCPKNMLRFGAYQASTAGGVATANAITNYNVLSKLTFANYDATLPIYPVQFGATAPVCTVQMWTNYALRYRYYTVLKCDYKFTFQNASTEINDPVSILWGLNTYGASSVGTTFPTLQPYHEAKQWKGISEIIIPSTPNPEDSATGIKVITGSYVPGSGERAVSNDGDVKRWTLLSDAAPSYQEDLFLMAYRGPFSSTGLAALRVQVEARYTIQFKEPYVQYRYPYVAATAIVESTDNVSYTYA